MSTFSARKAAMLDHIDREWDDLDTSHQLGCSSVGETPEGPCDCRVAHLLGMLAAARDFLDRLEGARTEKGYRDDEPCMVLDVIEKMDQFADPFTASDLGQDGTG